MSPGPTDGPRAAPEVPWALLGILAVAWSQFAWVRATNFGGTDEWLIVALTSRGVVDMPYANRPFVLLWQWLVTSLFPHNLAAFHVAHTSCLALSGCLVYLLCRRLAPGAPLLSFLAGVFAVVWAPGDYMRLDTVLLTGYAGFTFGTLLAIVLFLESWRLGSAPLLAVGALVGFVTARGFEGVLPLLLLGAPLLLAGTTSARSRRFWAWVVGWTTVQLLAAVIVVLPLLNPSGAGSYQGSALGLDLEPLRVTQRLLRQYGFHLLPLGTTPLGELAVSAVPVALCVFALACTVVVVRSGAARGGGDSGGRRVRLLVLGLVLAGLGYAAFTLSANIYMAARTQILSAPGIGIALAAGICLAVMVLPARWRRLGAAVLGAWVVAVGTGRTVAMQREWDEWRSRFGVQHRTLSQLTSLAPSLVPHTLVLLVDEAGAFPATFTFRHAVDYLYAGDAAGYVWGAKDFLYPTYFTQQGVLCLPWPVIRDAWGSRPTLYPYDEVLVVRLSLAEELSLLDRWPPDVLPPLPPSARYAPRARIRTEGPVPPARAILRNAR